MEHHGTSTVPYKMVVFLRDGADGIGIYPHEFHHPMPTTNARPPSTAATSCAAPGPSFSHASPGPWRTMVDGHVPLG